MLLKHVTSECFDKTVIRYSVIIQAQVFWDDLFVFDPGNTF